MTTKYLNINKAIFLLTLLALVPFITIEAKKTYNDRIDRYQERWQKLIPSYLKTQFAGSMGLLSFGTGWDYGRNAQWETDVFFGFVPKYSTEDFKVTFTLKQNFIPWNIALNDKFSFDPLSCGMYVNTIFNEDFWGKQPGKYPNGYYKFSTKVRFNAFLGQRITYNIDPKHRFFAKSATLFYEISSNDLYIVSAATNRYLKPKDYLVLSFGIKLQIL